MTVASNGSDRLTVKNFNLYLSTMATNRLWSRETPFSSYGEAFPAFSMSGYTLKIGAIPYEAYVTADEVEDPKDKNRIYENHDGYEIKMLQVQCAQFGF